MVARPNPVQAPSVPWSRIGTRTFRYSSSGRSVGTSISAGSYIRSLKSSVSARASRRRVVRVACFVVVLRTDLRFAMASYYQRIDVLINARAGRQSAAAVEQVSEAFRAAGLDAEIRLTEGP